MLVTGISNILPAQNNILGKIIHKRVTIYSGSRFHRLREALSFRHQAPAANAGGRAHPAFRPTDSNNTTFLASRSDIRSFESGRHESSCGGPVRTGTGIIETNKKTMITSITQHLIHELQRARLCAVC